LTILIKASIIKTEFEFEIKMKGEKMFILHALGNGFCAFLDFGAGTFIVFLTSVFLGHDVSIFSYFAGGVLGLVPDLDVLFMFVRKGKMYDDHHQWLTHRPIVMLPFSLIPGMIAGDLFWFITAGACIFWHFLHDTEGVFGGAGIAWFWPFSKKYISPFKAAIDPEESESWQYRLTQTEIMEVIWLRPSKTSLGELSAGSLLFSIVTGNIFGPIFGSTIFILIWITIVSTWLVYTHLKARH